MTATIDPLVQLANHGFLPFAGREPELARIREFCGGLDDAEGLCIALVTGEAGIGKSRLFEEALPGIVQDGACIVRARLHEDTAGELIPMLADSIWRSQTTRTIVKKEPERSLVPVLQAIRRLVRLRRVVVVIEDAHLLTGEGLEGFSALATGLADEPVGMLLSSRPGTHEIRGIVERYVALDMNLVGLNEEEIESLWHKLFGVIDIDGSLIRRLIHKTVGNPLAIRMALRTGVRADRGSPNASVVDLHLDRARLDRALDSSTRLLTDGLIAHLDEKEREWAARIAPLGEIVSVEAASIVLRTSPDALARLINKGILAHSPTIPTPLGSPGTSQSLPLLFTHSLLHRHFLGLSRLDIDPFWQVLANGAPLYTTLPFKRFGATGRSSTVDVDVLLRGITQYVTIIDRMIGTFNAAEGRALHSAFDATIADHTATVTGAPRLELELNLRYLRLLVYNYYPYARKDRHDEKYLHLIEDFLSLAQSDLPEKLLHFRIRALTGRLLYGAVVDNAFDLAIWNMIEQVATDHPDLMITSAYVDTLAGVLFEIDRIVGNMSGTWSWTQDINTVFDDVVHRVNTVLSLDDAKRESIVDDLCARVYPQLMLLYRDDLEYQRSQQLYAFVLRNGNRNDLRAHASLASFGVETQDVESVIPLIREYLQKRRESPRLRVQMIQYVEWFTILTLINTPLEGILVEYEKLKLEVEGKIHEMEEQYFLYTLKHQGALRCDERWIETFSRMIPDGSDAPKLFFNEFHCLLALGTVSEGIGMLREFLSDCVESGRPSFVSIDEQGGPVEALAYALFGLRKESEDELESGVRSFLRDQFLRFSSSIDLITILGLLLLDEDHGAGRVYAALRSDARFAMFRMMEWLIVTRRIVLVRFFTTNFSRFFQTSEREQWTKRIGVALERQSERMGTSAGEMARKTIVTVVERIGYQRPEQTEPTGIKGPRLKQLLGAMVLNAILPRPLDRGEFFSIVAEPGADEESRRNTVKVAVYQLRKMIGSECIVQGDGAPQFDFDHIRVDLVDAYLALETVEREFNDGPLKNAVSALFRTLHLLHGDVLFPTLYDVIFESARDEFDVRLRRALLDVCGALLHEGDTENCESLLRKGVEQLAGDQDLEELLARTLSAAEKRIEETRVRSRSGAFAD